MWLYPVHGHRTAIFDVEIVLNQWLEEIAKKEAPSRHNRNATVSPSSAISRAFRVNPSASPSSSASAATVAL